MPKREIIKILQAEFLKASSDSQNKQIIHIEMNFSPTLNVSQDKETSASSQYEEEVVLNKEMSAAICWLLLNKQNIDSLSAPTCHADLAN